MLSFTLKSAVLSLVLVQCATATKQGNFDCPFGLSFGHTYISASRTDASGQFKVFKYLHTKKYSTYFHEAVDKSGDTKYDTDALLHSPAYDEAILMFQDAVVPITEDLKNRTGKYPEYSPTITPSILPGWMQQAARVAVFANRVSGKKYMFGTSSKAAAHAYGFLQCKHLGRRQEDCRDGGPRNLVLLLEYEQEYLYAWLKEVDFELDGVVSYYQQICKDCGAQFRKEPDTEAYNQRLTDFLERFTHSAAMEWHTRRDIRALVISGDAPATAIANLAQITRQVLDLEHLNYLTEIDSSEVVARGVAYFAKLTVHEPGKFGVEVGNRLQDYPDEREHNEL